VYIYIYIERERERERNTYIHIFGCNYGAIEMLILHKQGLETNTDKNPTICLEINHIWVLCKLAREFLVVVAWSTTTQLPNSNFPKIFPKFSSIFSSQEVKKRRSMEMIEWGGDINGKPKGQNLNKSKLSIKSLTMNP